MDTEEHAAWVALSQTPGVGPKTFHQLLALFGSAAAVWRAKSTALQHAGVPQRLVATLLAARNTCPEERVAEAVSNGITIITLRDPSYPKNLQLIDDAPPVLYVQGQLALTDEQAIAIVGSRRMSSYGATVTHRLATDLASTGITIISGLARGVDAAAHTAALAAGGRTIAVLGGGLLHIYPKEHTALAAQIVAQGSALVSECAPNQPAVPGNFPARNRIISGLAKGIVVTEAAEQSGTMITVATALEQSREVLVVPGPITAEQSKGTNFLLKQGATPVTDTQDILELFQFRKKPNAPMPALDPDAAQVLQTIGEGNTETDTIIALSGLPTAAVLATLAMLQLQGLVLEVQPGVWVRG